MLPLAKGSTWQVESCLVPLSDHVPMTNCKGALYFVIVASW